MQGFNRGAANVPLGQRNPMMGQGQPQNAFSPAAPGIAALPAVARSPAPLATAPAAASAAASAAIAAERERVATLGTCRGPQDALFRKNSAEIDLIKRRFNAAAATATKAETQPVVSRKKGQ